MLTKLRLKNFKCWKDTGDLELKPITVFFGTNSSGKSSLMQAILALKQTAESQDPSQLLKLDGYVDLGGVANILHKNNESNKFSLSIGLENHLHLGFDFELLLSIAFQYSNNKLSLKEFSYSNLQSIVRCVLRGSEVAVSCEGAEIEALKSQKWLAPPLYKSYGIELPWFTVSYSLSNKPPLKVAPSLFFESIMKKTYYLGPMRRDPERVYLWNGELPSFVGSKGDNTIQVILASLQGFSHRGEEMKASATHNLISDIGLSLSRLGVASNFVVSSIGEDFSRAEVQLQITPNSSYSSIADVGYGISQVLPVVVACLSVPERSTILLEHPELHLHPSAQAALADLIVETSKSRKLQFIIESHSEHFLLRLQRRMAEAKMVTNDEVALYFCEIKPTGEAKATPLETDKYGSIKNWPKNFFGTETEDIDAALDARFRRERAEKDKKPTGKSDAEPNKKRRPKKSMGG